MGNTELEKKYNSLKNLLKSEKIAIESLEDKIIDLEKEIIRQVQINENLTKELDITRQNMTSNILLSNETEQENAKEIIRLRRKIKVLTDGNNN